LTRCSARHRALRARRFADWDGQEAVGEKTPLYLVWPDTTARLRIDADAITAHDDEIEDTTALNGIDLSQWLTGVASQQGLG
jgi:hypothetical protein